jgi:hypothetical protein
MNRGKKFLTIDTWSQSYKTFWSVNLLTIFVRLTSLVLWKNSVNIMKQSSLQKDRVDSLQNSFIG